MLNAQTLTSVGVVLVGGQQKKLNEPLNILTKIVL